jgi:hypothetical protein
MCRPLQVFSESLRKDEKIGSRRDDFKFENVSLGRDTQGSLSRLRDARKQNPSGRFPVALGLPREVGIGVELSDCQQLISFSIIPYRLPTLVL